MDRCPEETGTPGRSPLNRIADMNEGRSDAGVSMWPKRFDSCLSAVHGPERPIAWHGTGRRRAPLAVCNLDARPPVTSRGVSGASPDTRDRHAIVAGSRT